MKRFKPKSEPVANYFIHCKCKPALLVWLTLLMLMNVPFTAAALNQDWYQIDLIIFKPNSPIEPIAEKIALPSAALAKNRLPLLPLDKNNPENPYQLLAQNQHLLKSIHNALIQKHNYKILTEIAWRQPIRQNVRSRTIHFTGGRSFDKMENNNTPVNSNAHVPSIKVFWEVEGNLRTDNLGQFFSVKADITLRNPAKEIILNNGDHLNNNLLEAIPFTTFNLTQEHHLFKNKVEYFDHPAFGVLMKISSLKK